MKSVKSNSAGFGLVVLGAALGAYWLAVEGYSVFEQHLDEVYRPLLRALADGEAWPVTSFGIAGVCRRLKTCTRPFPRSPTESRTFPSSVRPTGS